MKFYFGDYVEANDNGILGRGYIVEGADESYSLRVGSKSKIKVAWYSSLDLRLLKRGTIGTRVDSRLRKI